ncbi:MAG TPA: hypothetical protein VEI58_02710 [Chthoniobacterales bacterium]|nr:hypothetical protein [Chthoniobacterales bacterium]
MLNAHKMALIPSESYSFPDDFVLTIGDARKSMRQPAVPPPEPEPLAEKVEPPVIEATVAQETEMPVNEGPVLSTVEPEQVQAPMEQAPPPVQSRVFIPSVVPATLKRKIRWNARVAPPQAASPANGAPGISPTNEVQLRPAPYVASPPKPKPDVRPQISLTQPMPLESELPPAPANIPFVPDSIPEARIVESPSADLMQTLLSRALFASAEPVENGAPSQNEAVPVATNIYTPENIQPAVFVETDDGREDFAPSSLNEEQSAQTSARRHYSPKMRHFLFCEAVAVGILVPFAILGLLRVFHNPVVIALIDVITIAAAVSATVMPIMFFAVSPPLPRGEE